MAYNIQAKKSIDKWRESNRLVYNEYMNAQMKLYYERNRAKCNLRRARNAKYKNECLRLRNILLD
jgi:hypothetical protein